MVSRGVPLLIAFVLAALVIGPMSARAADTIPPWANGWGPTGTGVPVSTGILVAWSEGMDWTSVPASFTYTDGVLVYSEGTWTHDPVRNTSAFLPAAALRPGTLYTVRFDTTARDPSGNRLDQNRNGVGGEPCAIGPPGFWDCLVWSFRTAPPPPDTTPPRVLATSPPFGGTSVSDAQIRIVFSESMDTASVESAFQYSDGYTLYTVADGSASWTATNALDDTFRFASRLEFASGGRITGYLFDNRSKDLAGNFLDGDGDGRAGGSFEWTFFVAPDPRPPRVLSTVPLAGAVNVSVSGSIRVQFSKSMSGSVALALTVRGPNGSNLSSNDGVGYVFATRFPDDLYVFDPYPNLETSSAYTLILSAAVAADREGLHLDGNGNGTADGSPSDDVRITFRTEAEDATAPAVVKRSPDAGAQDVHPATSLRVGFSEPMNRTSVESSFSYTDGVRTFGTADGAAHWWYANTTLDFLPSSALAYGARYTVTLAGAEARDRAGNPVNGGLNETWSFTVASQPDTTPPGIVSTSPFDGQRNVSRNARITIIFSESMNHTSVEEAVAITGGASLWDFRWPNDATLEVATAAPMAYRSPYSVLMFTGAQDLAGNSLPQPATIAFTTESWRGRVWGRVADTADVGIPGALVRLNGFSVVTNDIGGFSFDGVEQGTYTLTVSRDGYVTATRSESIEPGKGDRGTIVLEQPPVSAVDATLWATVGAGILVVLLTALWLRRRRGPPSEHYETWKPARVVVMEPGKAPPKVP
jgi:hypothetical protein